jgi:hypothetical protein
LREGQVVFSSSRAEHGRESDQILTNQAETAFDLAFLVLSTVAETQP